MRKWAFSVKLAKRTLGAFKRFGNTGILIASQYRYQMIKFGSLVSFLASILYYFALLTTSTLSNVLFSIVAVVINMLFVCRFSSEEANEEGVVSVYTDSVLNVSIVN